MFLKKRMVAICLAILMMVMLALPAAAEPASVTQDKVVVATTEYYKTLESSAGVKLTGEPKLTIRKYVNLDNDLTRADTSKPISGVQFKYVKVGNLYEIKVSDTNYVMAYGITNGFAEALGFNDSDGDYTDGTNLYFKNYSEIENKLKDQTKDTLKDFLVTTDGDTKVETNKAGVQDGFTGGEESGSVPGEFKATLNTDNPWGLYLVVEYDASNAKVKNGGEWEPVSITQIQAPFIVALPTLGTDNYWDEQVTSDVKNSTDVADVEKKIVVDNESTTDGTETVGDTDITSIGDTVHFRLKGTILDIPEQSNQSIAKYALTDVISQGLDVVLSDDNSKVKIDAVRVTGGAGGTTLSASDYEVSLPINYTAPKQVGEKDSMDADFTGGKYFTITFTEEGLQKLTRLAKETNVEPGTEKAVYFYYSAVVNENAVVGPQATDTSNNSGNPNKVKLNYQVSNSAEMATRWDKVTEFTFGIDVAKQFEGTTPTDVSAVTFKLYSSTDNGATKHYYSFVKATTGVYHTPTSAVDENAATQLKLGTDNKISLKGLDEGTYYLEETATVPGYNLLKEPVKVEITADKGGNAYVADIYNSATSGEYQGTFTQNDQKVGKVEFTVINTQGFQLPSTGGAGIWMFVIGGVIIIAAGGAYFLLTRKKKQ